MTTDLEQVLASISNLGNEIRDLRTDTQELKAVTQELKADTQELKAVTQELKVETQELKAKTENLKTLTQGMESDLEASNTKFDTYQKATQSVVNLAFSLIASATVVTIVSSVFRR